MGKLPGETPEAVRAIYAFYEAKERSAPRRGHLGGSRIGQECERLLWYEFRWVQRPAFPGQLLRLFNTGHREETRIVTELRNIGVQVLETDEHGQQFRFADVALGEHFSGSLDGVLRHLPGHSDKWFLAEFKTSNTKTFKKMKGKGVKSTKPEHYAQMQVYMLWAQLRQAVYIMVCKENDALYLEVLDYDEKAAQRYSKKAARIIQAKEPPSKIRRSIQQYPCSFCSYNEVCHENKVPDAGCRTCVHATPVLDEPGAKWTCEKHGLYPTLEEQERGCDDHLFIPALLPFAEPENAGDDFVVYKLRTKGGRFLNAGAAAFPGSDHPTLTSAQLAALKPADFDNVPTIEELEKAGV